MTIGNTNGIEEEFYPFTYGQPSESNKLNNIPQNKSLLDHYDPQIEMDNMYDSIFKTKHSLLTTEPSFIDVCNYGISAENTVPLAISLIDPAPKVIIPSDLMLKINYVVKRVNAEVGWYCSTERLPNGDVRLINIYIPAQKVHGTTTEISPEGSIALFKYLNSVGKATECNNLKCWSHSHMDMGVSPSGQDDIQFKELYDNEMIKDYFIRMIHNKENKISITLVDKVRSLQFKAITPIIALSFVAEDEIKSEIARLSAELSNNVKKKAFENNIKIGPPKSTHSLGLLDDQFSPSLPKKTKQSKSKIQLSTLKPKRALNQNGNSIPKSQRSAVPKY